MDTPREVTEATQLIRHSVGDEYLHPLLVERIADVFDTVAALRAELAEMAGQLIKSADRCGELLVENIALRANQDYVRGIEDAAKVVNEARFDGGGTDLRSIRAHILALIPVEEATLSDEAKTYQAMFTDSNVGDD